jgi:deoxycytidylate deaminase
MRVEVFMNFAKDLAKLSKCTERQVAAVITNKDLTQVYSIGLNGGPKGLADCLCITGGKYGCIHAEQNALIKCTSNDTEKVMFITLAPCKQCAAAIVNAPGGFSTVYYGESWHDDSGIKILKNAGIKVQQVTTSLV